jgi:DNA-binding transcriptional LysR family regulator
VDIKLLEDFVCLVKFQNFTAAARERTVTQSAFSRRIKALEEWLGTPLINREKNHKGQVFHFASFHYIPYNFCIFQKP